MTDSEPGPSQEDARLQSLDERLKQAQADEAVRTGAARKGQDENTRLGNRVLAELIGGIVGGLVIGYTIDYFAETAPWGLLVMLVLGIVVAFRNIIIISNRASKGPPGL